MAKNKVGVLIQAKDLASKTFRGVGREMNGLGGVARRLAGVMAGVFAVKGIADFGRAAVQTFTDAQAVWSRLGGALQNVGVNFADVRTEIEGAARAMQDVTTVGDEDFAAVLTELTQMSGNYGASLKNVQVVADLAAAKQIDLKTAAQLVGKAMIGETGTLKRYGIVVKEGESAVEAMRRQFAGMAEREGKTLAGQTKRLSNEWGDFKEAVGRAMVEAGGSSSIMEVLIGVMKGAAEWVGKNHGMFEGFAKVLSFTGTATGVLLEALQDLGDVLSGAVLYASSLVTTGFAKLARGAALATDAKAALMNLFSPEKTAAIRAQSAAMRADAEALERYAEAASEGAAAAIAGMRARHRRGAKPGRSGGPAAAPSAPPPPPPKPPHELTADEKRALKKQWAEAEKEIEKFQKEHDKRSLSSIIAPPSTFIHGKIEKDPRHAAPGLIKPIELTELQQIAQDVFGAITEIGQSSAYGVADAWSEAFGILFTNFDNVAGAAEAMAKGTAVALLGGLSDYAKQQSALQIAEGMKDLATGAWPPNPAALGAAGEHFAAAAAFAALAGAGAAGSRSMSSGGAGGRGGGGASPRASSRDSLDRLGGSGKGEAVIVLEGGFAALMQDPDAQDSFARMMEDLSDRRVVVRRG